MTGQVTAQVRERYAPDGGTDADEDAYLLAGDELDLEPLARDAVLLDLPLAPLCSEECLGLCPQCGANWNEGSCGCPPVTDARWSALDPCGTRRVVRSPPPGPFPSGPSGGRAQRRAGIA